MRVKKKDKCSSHNWQMGQDRENCRPRVGNF